MSNGVGQVLDPLMAGMGGTMDTMMKGVGTLIQAGVAGAYTPFAAEVQEGVERATTQYTGNIAGVTGQKAGERRLQPRRAITSGASPFMGGITDQMMTPEGERVDPEYLRGAARTREGAVAAATRGEKGGDFLRNAGFHGLTATALDLYQTTQVQGAKDIAATVHDGNAAAREYVKGSGEAMSLYRDRTGQLAASFSNSMREAESSMNSDIDTRVQQGLLTPEAAAAQKRATHMKFTADIGDKAADYHAAASNVISGYKMQQSTGLAGIRMANADRTFKARMTATQSDIASGTQVLGAFAADRAFADKLLTDEEGFVMDQANLEVAGYSETYAAQFREQESKRALGQDVANLYTGLSLTVSNMADFTSHFGNIINAGRTSGED